MITWERFGGAAGNRTRVQSAYYVRVYPHSSAEAGRSQYRVFGPSMEGRALDCPQAEAAIGQSAADDRAAVLEQLQRLADEDIDPGEHISEVVAGLDEAAVGAQLQRDVAVGRGPDAGDRDVGNDGGHHHRARLPIWKVSFWGGVKAGLGSTAVAAVSGAVPPSRAATNQRGAVTPPRRGV